MQVRSGEVMTFSKFRTLFASACNRSNTSTSLQVLQRSQAVRQFLPVAMSSVRSCTPRDLCKLEHVLLARHQPLEERLQPACCAMQMSKTSNPKPKPLDPNTKHESQNPKPSNHKPRTLNPKHFGRGEFPIRTKPIGPETSLIP